MRVAMMEFDGIALGGRKPTVEPRVDIVNWEIKCREDQERGFVDGIFAAMAVNKPGARH